MRTAKQKTKTAGEVGVFGENRTGCKTLIVVSNTILSCLLSRDRHKCSCWITYRLANFNVGQSKYLIPDVWTIGKVYARLIEDISSDTNTAETLVEVYESWIDARLSDYNSVFYFQSREYIAESYRSGAMLED